MNARHATLPPPNLSPRRTVNHGTRFGSLPARVTSRSGSRLPALDTARGMAMILVCLSHFTWSAVQGLGETRTFGWLLIIGMVASPTFILVSGITLGYMYAGEAEAYRHFVGKLRERGLLLLTAAHLLMIPAFHYMAPTPRHALRVLPITTTIGICLLVGPTAVVHMSRRQRIIFGGVLITLSWLLLFASPSDSQGTTLDAVRGALIGARGTSWWFYSFPVMPWLGAYLFGSAVGQEVRVMAQDGRGLRALLLRYAVWLVSLALLIEILVNGLAFARPSNHLLLELSRSAASSLSKVPPSPVYFLTFGAAGLTLTALADLLLDRAWLRPLTDRLGEIGRSSLPVFVVQSYLYYMVELHLLPPGRRSWPLEYLVSLAFVYATARLWLRLGGNRLLVMPGYARLHNWRAARNTLARD